MLPRVARVGGRHEGDVCDVLVDGTLECGEEMPLVETLLAAGAALRGE